VDRWAQGIAGQTRQRTQNKQSKMGGRHIPFRHATSTQILGRHGTRQGGMAGGGTRVAQIQRQMHRQGHATLGKCGRVQMEESPSTTRTQVCTITNIATPPTSTVRQCICIPAQTCERVQPQKMESARGNIKGAGQWHDAPWRRARTSADGQQGGGGLQTPPWRQQQGNQAHLPPRWDRSRSPLPRGRSRIHIGPLSEEHIGRRPTTMLNSERSPLPRRRKRPSREEEEALSRPRTRDRNQDNAGVTADEEPASLPRRYARRNASQASSSSGVLAKSKLSSGVVVKHKVMDKDKDKD
jgi:hypothetical protein